MKTELRYPTLYVHAESADPWTGTTAAIRVEGEFLVCGEVLTRAAPKKRTRLKICLEGKSASFLSEVEAWQAVMAKAEAEAIAQRNTSLARDQALLDVMEQEVTRLRSLIPACHIEVIATEILRVDGDPVYRYAVEGFEISYRDCCEELVFHGWAIAIRPGAMAPFATRPIISISRDARDAIQKKISLRDETAQAEKKAEEARTAAIFAQARQSGERVALRTRGVVCSDPMEECSWDIITVWAMPDGTQKETQIHAW